MRARSAEFFHARKPRSRRYLRSRWSVALLSRRHIASGHRSAILANGWRSQECERGTHECVRHGDKDMLKRHRREASVAIAIIALAIVLAIIAPGYFTRENLSDLLLANMPVLIIALGMMLIILTGQIDISVGSIFAVCSVAAGVFAKSGLPLPLAGLAACLIGAALGALNGALIAYVNIPSIVVTLATMVALRDALRWATQGAWIQDLPRGFQWLGFTPSVYLAVTCGIAAILPGAMIWGMRNVAAARQVYATGSNRDAARLSGIQTSRVILLVFVFTGALT